MLNGKRYLLVLDDVWGEDQDNWDRLKYFLACGSKGASIIVTTRVAKVASIMGTVPAHHLSLLSEEDCWLLFKQRAFGQGNEEHPNLVAIGKEIVKKCGGVPLAAKALGGLMRFKSEETDWHSVQESEIWNLPQDKNSILPLLRLSYYNLPLELRRCFAYCAIFLKGSEIEKEKLIHLWMANGFISSNGKSELEDIGNGIWNELYWRSFFQDVDKNSSGGIIFKIHDLMHDLAQSVMEDECHMMETESSNNISAQRIHHVTLVADYMHAGVFPKALYRVESLRTILQQIRQPDTYSGSSFSFSCDFTNFGSLRVFDALGTNMGQLSSSIGKLKHLTYLNLSKTLIRTLPKSICSLHNLQTLNLNACYILQRLPKNMKSLRSLRHLYLEGCHKIQDMPPKLGHLTLLRTLSLFVVGESRGHRVVELQCLDLGGELCIRHLERVRNSTDAKEANLVGKQNLRILKLSWEYNSESESQVNVEQLLESLEPHPNVEELFIDNYRGAHFPPWMGDSIFKNVVSIELRSCTNCLVLPAFGQLPSLRRLEISKMDYVEYIDNYFPGGSPVRGFPALEVLHISKLPNLVGLSREEGRELLPCLHEINIHTCPKLTLPRLSSPKLLNVASSSNVVLSSISNLNHLTTLSVYGGDMISFPEEMLQNLTVLESLSTWGCHEIESLPDHGLRSLKSLQRLTIEHCYKLSYLSESLGHLTALEELNVSGCPKLVTLPDSIKHLVSLRHLDICGLPRSMYSHDLVICAELKTLPEALKHVPALQSLSICDYPELTSLPEWLGDLTSLQSLCISGSPTIPSLPHGFQRLTNLQTLSIYGCCPELVRRCQKEKGEDWYKIAHIPKINLDDINEIERIESSMIQRFAARLSGHNDSSMIAASFEVVVALDTLLAGNILGCLL
ncbi:unnamed protein product [Camellia sinensis]